MDDLTDKKKGGVPRKRYEIPKTATCHVCGDQAAEHLHYGGIACYSCRAFFRRTVNNTRPVLECSNSNNCKINKDTRKRCQACRFQKCKDIGMKPSWVLSEVEKSRLQDCGRRNSRVADTVVIKKEDEDDGSPPMLPISKIKDERPSSAGQSDDGSYLGGKEGGSGVGGSQEMAASRFPPQAYHQSPVPRIKKEVDTSSPSDVQQAASWSPPDISQIAGPSGNNRNQLSGPSGNNRNQFGEPSGNDRKQLAGPSGNDRNQLASPSGNNRNQYSGPGGNNNSSGHQPQQGSSQQTGASGHIPSSSGHSPGSSGHLPGSSGHPDKSSWMQHGADQQRKSVGPMSIGGGGHMTGRNWSGASVNSQGLAGSSRGLAGSGQGLAGSGQAAVRTQSDCHQQLPWGRHPSFQMNQDFPRQEYPGPSCNQKESVFPFNKMQVSLSAPGRNPLSFTIETHQSNESGWRPSYGPASNQMSDCPPSNSMGQKVMNPEFSHNQMGQRRDELGDRMGQHDFASSMFNRSQQFGQKSTFSQSNMYGGGKSHPGTFSTSTTPSNTTATASHSNNSRPSAITSSQKEEACSLFEEYLRDLNEKPSRSPSAGPTSVITFPKSSASILDEAASDWGDGQMTKKIKLENDPEESNFSTSIASPDHGPGNQRGHENLQTDSGLLSSHGQRDPSLLSPHGQRDPSLLSPHGQRDPSLFSQHGQRDPSLLSPHGQRDPVLLSPPPRRDSGLLSPHNENVSGLLSPHHQLGTPVQQQHFSPQQQPQQQQLSPAMAVLQQQSTQEAKNTGYMSPLGDQGVVQCSPGVPDQQPQPQQQQQPATPQQQYQQQHQQVQQQQQQVQQQQVQQQHQQVQQPQQQQPQQPAQQQSPNQEVQPEKSSNMWDFGDFMLNPLTNFQETIFLEQLAAIDENLKSQVPMDEEHCRSFLMCALTGAKVRQYTILHAYQILIKRIVRLSNSIQDFIELVPGDMHKLLVANTVSMINVRIARWFHPKTSLEMQLSLCSSSSDLYNEVKVQRDLDPQFEERAIQCEDVFVSPWCCDSDFEDRYFYLLNKMHQLPLDSTPLILLSVCLLFNSEKVTGLEQLGLIVSNERKFSYLLFRHLQSKYTDEVARSHFQNFVEAKNHLIEMADILINKRLIC